MVCVYLEQEVHKAAMRLHLIFQLVQDDEGSEREADALWMKRKQELKRKNMFESTVQEV